MLAGIILAAGKGTRFKSKKPKVLYTLLDQPMVWYVCRALKEVVDKLFVVVGYGKDEVCKEISSYVDGFIHQKEQLGTGHALMCAVPYLLDQSINRCIVANGDMPLVEADVFKRLRDVCVDQSADIGIVTAIMSDPTGYGRILRDENGKVKGIIEEKDIEAEELKRIKEVNTGIYYFDVNKIKDFLNLLSNENAQKEYYLTDLLEIGYKKGLSVVSVKVEDEVCVLGANNPVELLRCEKLLQQRINQRFLQNGVVIRNVDLVRIGPEVEIEPGVEVLGPLDIYGKTIIKEGTVIENNVVIKSCIIGRECRIRSFCYLEEATIGDRCNVGPFSRLRPGTVLDEEVRIGNFVEVKKSHLEKGVKANHLAYLGDATVGEDTNIGAGTITCNYDGYKKHPTFIGKKAFIGSNTSLVAPVRIGDNSVVGAGSTITKDVPEGMLAVGRARQKNIKYKKLKRE